ncbi:MAG TPA: hypothetical protein VKH41_13745 [Myxococcota bacterium]|nr:hypothetical protein [Myxococcota bacterium]
MLALKFLGLDGQQVIEGQMAMLLGSAGREIAHQMIASARASEGWLAAIVSAPVLLWARPTYSPSSSPR